MALTMKRHDTRTAIKAALKSPKGLPVNLSNTTVKFTMAKYRNGAVLVDREAITLDAVNGVVCFVFEQEETTTLGMMKAEFEVKYEDGSIEKFPNQGYILINFEADLA
ncbi:BppU family phage baseplate upper protein [Paenibacillus frigoriresistens]|uniref:BppU family phage baseplate upper protein n=1 Tax=Paenibacillus alginolyticus TaxID=59839 RepID=UPI0015655624|nr:BppU family phage baseplate upper protein [Paenibacillus frigoriresistens]NRF91518.1 BppU family phage baseplate upper protein [Paenibacillus frigoriresistens]